MAKIRPTPKRRLQWIGPGLVTGASDDDPSGIATYSQVGAKFGFGMLWTLLFTYPLMSAVQETSAQVARVTGKGLAANFRRAHGRLTVLFLVTLLTVANVINLGADLAAMGAAAALLLPGPIILYAAAFAILCLTLQILVPYRRYALYLKWLTLALLAYVGTVFTLEVPWSEVAWATIVPRFAIDKNALAALVAILGTTISPYLFFWQASQETEAQREAPNERPLNGAPEQAPVQLRHVRIDTYAGMFVSNAVAYFIMLTCALTLFASGIHDIKSADQAAAALRPIAGDFAFALFALGIIGTGLLAAPVLAGSAAYAVSEALSWPEGLGKKFRQAPKFYGIIAAAMGVGVALNSFGFDPIRGLYLAAILNGLIAPVIQVFLLRLARNDEVMGRLVIGKRLMITGWVATMVMGAAAIALLVSLGL